MHSAAHHLDAMFWQILTMSHFVHQLVVKQMCCVFATMQATALPPAPPVIEPPVVPAPVKNDFAERMARQAMERLALRGTSTGSGSTVASTSIAAAAPPPKPIVQEPRVVEQPQPAPPAPPSISEADANDERPRLKLQPRTLPVEGGAALPASHGDEGGRPRLNLQPRTKPADTDTSDADKSAANKKASIFGNARSREEVLKERGIDATVIDGAGSFRSYNSGPHHGFSTTVRSSRAGSVTSGFSGDDQVTGDQWLTVGQRGRARGR